MMYAHHRVGAQLFRSACGHLRQGSSLQTSSLFKQHGRCPAILAHHQQQQRPRWMSDQQQGSKGAAVVGDGTDEPDIPLVGLFKNPIVQQLWTARQAAKERRGGGEKKSSPQQSAEASSSSSSSSSPPGKTPSESRVEVSYPFSKDANLTEAYRNPWNLIRVGKMLEDLDALAGNIAFFHVDDNLAEGPDGATKAHPVIVTASVDRIHFEGWRPSVTADQHLSGQVTWTGRSSMEIRMQCRDAEVQARDDDKKNDGVWLEAFVTFVTLDPETRKPMNIPQILPQNDEERLFFKQGAARAALKKKRRQERGGGDPEAVAANNELAQKLLQEAGPLLNMPSLANPHDILMSQTKMQNALMAQPQLQNLHGRIFGGFLVRRAFELAFANAYVFGGARPTFLEVDEVSFKSPVSVGDLLVFNSRVLATLPPNPNEGAPSAGLPRVQIEVEAWVTEPEQVTARLSNQFYFCFAINRQGVGEMRRVLPGTMDEAQRMALRLRADAEEREDDARSTT